MLADLQRAADMWRYYTKKYGFDLSDWPYTAAVSFCTLMGTQYPKQ